MKYLPLTRPSTPFARARDVAISLTLGALVLVATGCRVVYQVADVPGHAVRAMTPGSGDPVPVDPVDVQQRLLRFANEFSAATMPGLEGLRRGTNPIAPVELVKWKIIFVSETTAIVSGPNAIANLLDLTAFVTVSREFVEDQCVPNIYGESARPLLETFRALEADIWRITATVLPPAQQEELRGAIAEWRRKHPVVDNILGSRAAGFAMEVVQAQARPTEDSGSVFSLLRLDPLAGLDPATREIARARLFAERALYLTQWLPTLLRWQAELLSLNAVAMPEVQQLVANSTQLTASIEHFARVAEQLPRQVTAEREEIVSALQSQEKGLAALAGEFRQTLTAGAQMSTSLNTTLVTFDALMKRFGVGEPKVLRTNLNTNSRPFNVLDYEQTAAQLANTAQQLTELLRTVDQTTGTSNLSRLTAQFSPVVQQARTGGKEIVDYAFEKGILLVLISLGAALIYRIIASRLTATRSGTRQP